MNMLTKILLLVMTCGEIVLAQSVAAPAGEKARELRFDPKIPIAARIRNEDREVTLTKNAPPPLEFYDDRTVDETLDEYVKLHDTVAVVRGFSSAGKLVDNGTWVQTTVDATVIEFIKSRTLPPTTKRVTFWHDAGEAYVKHVRVRAGAYPVFSQEDRYLLFLGRDEEGQLYLSQVFRLRHKLLESVPSSNGAGSPLRPPFKGQSEHNILELLRKAARTTGQ